MEVNQVENVVKGYKVFRPDWTCGLFWAVIKKYTCPGIFEEDGSLKVCGHGMHFCKNAADCFNYYQFNPANHVAEVIAHGEVKEDGDKCCTNKLEIVREIPWDEVLRLVNTGKDCTGFRNAGNWNAGNCNTGDYNTGNRNAGDCNNGNWNTGDYNTGDHNTGDWNTGDWNTGDWNTGDWNTGDWNTGDWNTGDWNLSSFNSGCFMTEEPTIMMFNKPSDWTYRTWIDSEARCYLNQIPKSTAEWIYSEDMTDTEKNAHPEHEITGGYLKVLDKSECGQMWWDELLEYRREAIKSLPNFDAEIFEKCTGIKVV